MSIYLKISTSCSLTPYYSLELEEISSTSHSGISRVAIHMICCVSRAKILNYDAPDGQRRILTSLFLFFDIFVIFQYFSLFFMFLMYLFGFSIEFPARGWSQTVRICKILKNRFFHIYVILGASCADLVPFSTRARSRSRTWDLDEIEVFLMYYYVLNSIIFLNSARASTFHVNLPT